MPKRKYSPKKDIPKIVRKLQTISPTEISNEIFKEFCMKRTPQSIILWFKENTRVKEKLERELNDNNTRLKNEQMKSDEEIKELDKVTQTQEIKVIDTQRVHARDRIIKTTSQIPKIKLNLNDFKCYPDAIRYALDNIYRWIPYNIKEIREYLKELKGRLNPERKDSTGNLLFDCWDEVEKEDYDGRIYSVLEKIESKPKYQYEGLNWLVTLLDLWELSRPKTKKVRELQLTTKEWYNRIGIDFPAELEPEANYIIKNLADLVRTGIFEDIDYKIKHSLKIEDDVEYAYHNWDKLDKLEKTRIHSTFLTEKKSLENHPYYGLILEKIKYNEISKKIE